MDNINPTQEIPIMDTLLHFSGGIDSTFVLWKYLKDNPDKILLIHHNHLENHTQRHHYEKKAVNSILMWLKKAGYTNFKYVETSYKQPNNFNIIYDIFLYNSYLTPVLFKTFKSLKYVLRGTIRDDLTGSHRIREQNSEKACALILGYEPIWIKQNHIYTKKEEIEQMPKELFNLTWWCRTPKNGVVCHKCHTCQIVDLALKELNYDNPKIIQTSKPIENIIETVEEKEKSYTTGSLGIWRLRK
jgi:7-cyano-7-deazaguanine synthase in queuosine biosynthesis